MPVFGQSRGSAQPFPTAPNEQEVPEVARSLGSVLGNEGEPSRVVYTFCADAARAARWLVSHVSLRESISACYAVEVHLHSLEGDEPSDLLGSTCTVTIERDDYRRFVHGVISKVECTAGEQSGRTVDIVVVPALQLLGQRKDTRIFANKSVPEVLGQVLGSALAPYERTHQSRLRRASYLRREYIVQYAETDLAFIERLMSEEGIWYAFEFPEAPGADGRELLVWVDNNDDALKADLGGGGDELAMQLEHGGTAYWQSVSHFSSARQLSPTSLAVRAYNWTRPSAFEAGAAPQEEPGERPLYEPHGVALEGFSDDRFTQFDTAEQTRLRWEYHQAAAQSVVGRSNVVGLIPGQKVVVRGHSAALDGAWIVLSVEARGRDAKTSQQAVEHLEDYANTFLCARYELPHRPRRLDKPRVHGIQTALVVGPNGRSQVEAGEDDIYTDSYGRIQVKLSWDRTRADEPDATTTCFLRVAQTWAGSGWGFVFTPRIGMEVIVSFVDGDPDYPLVIGSVYNGRNRPAHELPVDKTKSYIKTQSSPSGEGGNELQFEDADGKQQVYLHAQRDHLQVVGHDQTTRVKANQTVDVGLDRTETVGGHEQATIKKARTHTVHGADTLRIVDGSERLVEVSGNDTKRVSKKRELVVTQSTKETYVGGRETTVKNGDTLHVLEGAHKRTHVSGQYNIEADEHFKVRQGDDQLFIKDTFYASSAGDVQLKNDGFHLFARRDGKTTIEVESELTIKVGRASITMKSDGTIEIAGPSVTKLVAQGGSFEANVAGIVASGTTTKLAGTALTEITGALVKIN